jgi:hypothetical protein
MPFGISNDRYSWSEFNRTSPPQGFLKADQQQNELTTLVAKHALTYALD